MDNNGKLIVPTLIYAILFTLFIYKNFSGITMPLFSLSTVVYCLYCFSIYEIKLKKDTYLYAAVIVLLGVSSFMTGSIPIIALNFIGIVLMTLCLLMHSFFNDEHWDLGKYVFSIIELIGGALVHVPSPFIDIAYVEKNKEKKSKGLYVIIGLAIAFPLLIIIVSLLYAADAVFADVIKNVFKGLSLFNIIGIIFTFAFAFMAAYCSMRFLGKRKISELVKDRRRLEPIIAITVLALLSIVYLVFSLIQILYLFIGNMKLPEGYTYASYAHEGFFQLLFVCILNVIIVIFAMRFFKKSVVIKIFLTIISLCTYIMIASSALRMWLYVNVYSLSVLRLFVFWGLAVLAVLFVGILIQVFKDDFHLFRFSLAVVCVFYLCLSFGHMDYWVAKFNLGYVAENNGSVDYMYLTRLSSDAAPVIAEQEGSWVSVYAHKQLRLADEGIRKFNVSHYNACHAFSEYYTAHKDDYMVMIRSYNNSDYAISKQIIERYKPENIEKIECVYCTPIEGESRKEDIAVFEKCDDGYMINSDDSASTLYITYIPKDFFKGISDGMDISCKVTYANNFILNSDHTYITSNHSDIINLYMERFDNQLSVYAD